MNLYKNRDLTRTISMEDSPILRSHYFKISIAHNVDSEGKGNTSLVDEEMKYNTKFNVEGVMDTLPGISYQTSWDSSPVSVI